jgi:branched-chain amino acid transport system permease protein
MALFAEYVVRGLLLGAVYGLLALPMSLVFLTAGTIDFAVGAYALLAAAVAATIGGVAGLVAGLAASLLAAGVMAGIFALLKRSGAEDPITVALASFGVAVAIGSLVLWVWGTRAFVVQPFSVFWDLLGIRISPQSAINLGLSLAVVALLYAILYGTDLGRMMRAAAVNPRGAELAAIPVIGVQCATLLVGGVLGGVAGLLILFTSGLDFTAGLGLTLSGFAAAIVFGIEGPVRGFLGGLMLGVVEAVSAGYTSGPVTAAVPLVFILGVLSAGLLGGARFSGDRP